MLRIEFEMHGFNMVKNPFWARKGQGYDEDLMTMTKWFSVGVPFFYVRVAWRSK